MVDAREELSAALQQIGCELGDIRNFFVTHVHIDHYSLAVELRKTLAHVVSLGEEEQANLVAARASGHVDRRRTSFIGDLRRLGAVELPRPLPGRISRPPGSRSNGKNQIAGWTTRPSSP